MATLEQLSLPLSKALRVANSQAAQYQVFSPQNASPGGPPLPDGVIEIGHGGMMATHRIKLAPFGTGQPGQQFTMRLYGWEFLGPPDANPNLVVWLPRFLVGFYCTLSNLPGPGLPTYLNTNEYICDSVTITEGSAGPWYSGASSQGPGSGLMAWALVDVTGCRYAQFDFSRAADDVSADSFNCLWARA